ncbi:MAG: serine hydrolase domain-containing protein, partial [Bacteroidota bacterium]
MKKVIYLSLFLILSVQTLSGQIAEATIRAFDDYVEANRQKFQVPGCAVVVVKDGEVVLQKGYGERSVEADNEVDTKTLFGIMSTTKATTAVAMGLLVDQGKVDWEDRVLDYLPNFQLYDPYVTRELRIKDLFTHNAGLGNADFLWVNDPKNDQDEILSQMRYAAPSYTFRGGYTYQNIMYLAAGKVIEKITGMSWARFMKEQVYQPLGMENTFPTLAYSAQYGNKSVAHQRLNGEIITIPEMPADAIGPAGSTWSTIEDMTKWVQFLLDEGKVGDQQLLAASTLAEILKPQVIVPEGQFYPTTRLTQPHWTTYGLGWFQQDYRGEFLAFHTGSLDGRTAIVGLVPDHNFGFYFFGNLDHAELRHALMLKAIDVFVKEDNARDWGEEINTMYSGFRKTGEESMQKVMDQKIEETTTSKA